jgi:hypothetical protein
MDTVREQILEEIDHLTPDQQAQVLSMMRQLRQSTPPHSILPPGTSGDVLLAAQDRFKFSPGDVDEMMQAIEAR